MSITISLGYAEHKKSNNPSPQKTSIQTFSMPSDDVYASTRSAAYKKNYINNCSNIIFGAINSDKNDKTSKKQTVAEEFRYNPNISDEERGRKRKVTNDFVAAKKEFKATEKTSPNYTLKKAQYDKARHALIEEYMPYTRKLALVVLRQIVQPAHNAQISTADIAQVAYSALIKATDAYNEEYDTEFMSFAYFRIRGDVIKYITKNCSDICTIPLFARKGMVSSKDRFSEEEIAQKNIEIAEQTKTSPKTVQHCRDVLSKRETLVRLDADDFDLNTMADKALLVSEQEDPIYAARYKEAEEIFQQYMSYISDERRTYMNEYLKGKNGMQIAKTHGVSCTAVNYSISKASEQLWDILLHQENSSELAKIASAFTVIAIALKSKKSDEARKIIQNRLRILSKKFETKKGQKHIKEQCYKALMFLRAELISLDYPETTRTAVQNLLKSKYI